VIATILASGEVALDLELATEAEGAETEAVEAEPDEAENPILPAADELFWGTIAFLLLFVLLAKFAYPPVKKAMEDRTERIRQSLDEAEQTRTEAESIRAEYQRQLDDARNEAARIIEEARQTADTLKRDLQARAEADVAEQRARNAEQLSAERDRVMAEISTEVKQLAIELAERVVEANLDREANMRIIEDYLRGVGSTPASGTR
jgi:F-type H+-transporting ATPase subunit b